MWESGNVTSFTVSELFMDNQKSRGGNFPLQPPSLPRLRLKEVQFSNTEKLQTRPNLSLVLLEIKQEKSLASSLCKWTAGRLIR